LIYQKFSGSNEPTPPYEGLIHKDLQSRWLIEYTLLDGTSVFKRILKGCCSTQPIESFTKEIEKTNELKRKKKTKKKATVKRVRLEL
jgi:hypothetical protein